MIAPIAGLAVKGAIFHQGYNNCFNGTEGAVMYGQVFPHMIAAWRAAFNDPKLPFGILSLCTEGPVQTLENFTAAMCNAGPYIREAQYRTFLNLYQNGDSNIGYASTYDLRRRWYHPQLKVPAGERIARWALATQYGFEKQLQWKPPFLAEMKAADGTLTLRFDEPVGPVDDGSPIVGFAVAGTDRKFQPATASFLESGKDARGRAQLDNKSLVLSSPLVPQPVHFRYAWARSPLGNLQASGNSDIPFATHRSDDWPMEQIPLEAANAAKPDAPERQQRANVLKLLQQIDLDRRIREARALIGAGTPE
jgi:sialate O-acetylesterase